MVQAGNAVHCSGPGPRTEVYCLPDLWAFHLYSYTAELVIDGISHQIRPGTVSLVPPGAVTEYRYTGPSRHDFVHFSAACSPGGDVSPLVLNPGRSLPDFDVTFRNAVRHAATAPDRARAEIWVALHRLLDQEATFVGSIDYVAQALSIIESNLEALPSVAELAREIGISHTHLTRLFRTETGRTVIGYMRHRRIERAVHLLRNSTLPISAVAASVGYEDTQAFNKACRIETGLSPRSLRGRGDRPRDRRA
ncbi:AraC family transcriptional regulator [Tsukamurella strandjordii]|uniref:helix-turn-helix domain-containing protein n=1 Tax=Tsukamurella strandjordii TaxID=147577 RepID=UPI0031D6ADD0